ASRSTLTGPPFLRSMSRANSLAAATSWSRCTSPASFMSCLSRKGFCFPNLMSPSATRRTT
ncbi:hypothetical protein GGI11_008616, partial [Coemansia sp. RSA 2049]